MSNKLEIEELISGEKIELICDVIIGYKGDIDYNSKIASNVSDKKIKFMSIPKLLGMKDNEYDNPRFIFIYTHYIPDFNKSLVLKLRNPFVLVSHNSDQNINSIEEVKNILENDKLIHWWSQNLNILETCYDNICKSCISLDDMSYSSKVSFLPIGIANSMWNHGKTKLYEKLFDDLSKVENIFTFWKNIKKQDFYFSFSEGTNRKDREYCKNVLISRGLKFKQSNLGPGEYIKQLVEYKMAICPVGNGLDTHRLWECFYCGVVPIVLNTGLNMNIAKYIPMIILNRWEDFEQSMILDKYEKLLEETKEKGIYYMNDYIYFSTWKNRILST